MSSQNQSGLITNTYMPIKQPGETGPKPMIAKMAKTERHLICVRFMSVRSVGYPEMKRLIYHISDQPVFDRIGMQVIEVDWDIASSRLAGGVSRGQSFVKIPVRRAVTTVKKYDLSGP